MISKIKIALCILFCGVGFFTYAGNSQSCEQRRALLWRLRSLSLKQNAGQQVSDAEKDFHGARLDEFDLTDLNLNGINLSNASIVDTTLRRTSLRYANLDGVYMNPYLYTVCTELGTILDKTDFTGASMIEAVLDSISFGSSILVDVNFKKANLNFALLSGANTKGANFCEAKMFGVSVTREQRTTACLHGAFIDPK